MFSIVVEKNSIVSFISTACAKRDLTSPTTNSAFLFPNQAPFHIPIPNFPFPTETQNPELTEVLMAIPDFSFPSQTFNSELRTQNSELLNY